MALTASLKQRSVFGDKQVRFVDVTFDSSYPTGGETLAASLVDLNKIEFVLAAPAAGLVFEYDHANDKLKAIFPSGGVDAAPTSLSAPTITGTGTAVTGATAAGEFTPGIGKEVGNTADLSSVTTRVLVVGY